MTAHSGKGWLLKMRIVGATFAVCSSPIGFGVFAIMFHNYYAGIANAIVGIIGAFNLHLHLSFKNDLLTEKYSSKALAALKWTFLAVGLLGLVAAITFFSVAAVHKIPVLPIETSMILPGIQSFLVVQECATHFFCRRKYLRLLGESDRANLVHEEQVDYNSTANGSAGDSVMA